MSATGPTLELQNRKHVESEKAPDADDISHLHILKILIISESQGDKIETLKSTGIPCRSTVTWVERLATHADDARTASMTRAMRIRLWAGLGSRQWRAAKLWWGDCEEGEG
jgi:hypothetical protein